MGEWPIKMMNLFTRFLSKSTSPISYYYALLNHEIMAESCFDHFFGFGVNGPRYINLNLHLTLFYLCRHQQHTKIK